MWKKEITKQPFYNHQTSRKPYIGCIGCILTIIRREICKYCPLSWYTVIYLPLFWLFVAQRYLRVQYRSNISKSKRQQCTFLVKFFYLLMYFVLSIKKKRKKTSKLTKKCMASGRCIGLRPDDQTFLCKFDIFQMAVSCLRLGLFALNLGIL